ncbi:MAG: hypothetical protein K7J15_04570 [Candidatus Regiella insecticola]|nr:hypothetical protein [Candidatus Regiella insecticola]
MSRERERERERERDFEKNRPAGDVIRRLYATKREPPCLTFGSS